MALHALRGGTATAFAIAMPWQSSRSRSTLTYNPESSGISTGAWRYVDNDITYIPTPSIHWSQWDDGWSYTEPSAPILDYAPRGAARNAATLPFTGPTYPPTTGGGRYLPEVEGFTYQGSEYADELLSSPAFREVGSSWTEVLPAAAEGAAWGTAAFVQGALGVLGEVTVIGDLLGLPQAIDELGQSLKQQPPTQAQPTPLDMPRYVNVGNLRPPPLTTTPIAPNVPIVPQPTPPNDDFITGTHETDQPGQSVHTRIYPAHSTKQTGALPPRSYSQPRITRHTPCYWLIW